MFNLVQLFKEKSILTQDLYFFVMVATNHKMAGEKFFIEEGTIIKISCWIYLESLLFKEMTKSVNIGENVVWLTC